MQSVADQTRASQIADRLNSLRTAEAIWTAGAARRRSEESEALLIVADQILNTLASIKEDVPFVVRLASELDESAFESAASHPQMPPELVSSFRRLADAHGGVTALVREHVERLGEVLSSKREAIEAEAGRLRSGEPPVAGGGADADGCVIGLGMCCLSPALWPAGITLAILSCPV